MIQANTKNDIALLDTGHNGLVRLDGSLTDPSNKIIKQKNGEIKIMRK